MDVLFHEHHWKMVVLLDEHHWKMVVLFDEHSSVLQEAKIWR